MRAALAAARFFIMFYFFNADLDEAYASEIYDIPAVYQGGFVEIKIGAYCAWLAKNNHMRVRLYYNWLQLTDNGVYVNAVLMEKYPFESMITECNVNLTMLPDNDTICVIVDTDEYAGYKLKLSHHDPATQNFIIDTLLPLL